MTDKPNGPMDSDPSKATILVVDDNSQNLELLQAYLEDLGCKVISAVDGVEAMEAVVAHDPDLILLDIMMPRMSGFEVCRRLKEDESTAGIPVVMVTALKELLTRVKSLLRVRHLKGELERTLAYLQEVDSPKKS